MRRTGFIDRMIGVAFCVCLKLVPETRLGKWIVPRELSMKIFRRMSLH